MSACGYQVSHARWWTALRMPFRKRGVTAHAMPVRGDGGTGYGTPPGKPGGVLGRLSQLKP
jgi:hypothetical protein